MNDIYEKTTDKTSYSMGGGSWHPFLSKPFLLFLFNIVLEILSKARWVGWIIGIQKEEKVKWFHFQMTLSYMLKIKPKNCIKMVLRISRQIHWNWKIQNQHTSSTALFFFILATNGLKRNQETTLWQPQKAENTKLLELKHKTLEANLEGSL